MNGTGEGKKMIKHVIGLMTAAALDITSMNGAAAVGLSDRYAPGAAEPFRNFQIKVGVSGVLWNDENHGVFLNGAQIAGASAHVDDLVLPTATLTYYLSRNIAAELFCCFAHPSVFADGTLRTGLGQNKVADTWAFPPILTLQYHFDHMGAFRPYVGAGMQWIHYFSSNSDLNGGLAAFNRVKFRDSFGPALQAGFDYDLGGGWSVGLDAKYVWEGSNLTWTDAVADRITTKHDLDPLILTANLGYRFNLDELFGRRATVPLK
jgi:outer membrane protein